MHACIHNNAQEKMLMFGPCGETEGMVRLHMKIVPSRALSQYTPIKL